MATMVKRRKYRVIDIFDDIETAKLIKFIKTDPSPLGDDCDTCNATCFYYLGPDTPKICIKLRNLAIEKFLELYGKDKLMELLL